MRNVTRVYRACAGLSLFSLFYAKIAKMKIFLFPHAPDAHMHGTQGRQMKPSPLATRHLPLAAVQPLFSTSRTNLTHCVARAHYRAPTACACASLAPLAYLRILRLYAPEHAVLGKNAISCSVAPLGARTILLRSLVPEDADGTLTQSEDKRSANLSSSGSGMRSITLLAPRWQICKILRSCASS